MDDEKKPKIIVPEPGQRPRERQREIKIEWKNGEPQLGDLTRAEALGVLHVVLKQSRELGALAQHADRQRAQLANVIIAMVHRDSMRGLLDASGQPTMPMQSVVPPESVATFRKVWSFRADPQPDGSIAVIVEPMKDPNAPESQIVVTS
jgi:hypothetical protein